MVYSRFCRWFLGLFLGLGGVVLAFTLENYAGVVDPVYLQIVIRSIVYAAITTAICLLAGYPVVDVKVRLLDGQAHEVDSSERSFKIAASMAMRDALREEPLDMVRLEFEAILDDVGTAG